MVIAFIGVRGPLMPVKKLGIQNGQNPICYLRQVPSDVSVTGNVQLFFRKRNHFEHLLLEANLFLGYPLDRFNQSEAEQFVVDAGDHRLLFSFFL